MLALRLPRASRDEALTAFSNAQQPSPLSFVHLRRSTQLIGSTITGSLTVLDARTPDITTGETVLAHTGGISQLETEGNYIVTIGFTMRCDSGLFLLASFSPADPALSTLTDKACHSPIRTSSSTTPATSALSRPSPFRPLRLSSASTRECLATSSSRVRRVACRSST